MNGLFKEIAVALTVAAVGGTAGWIISQERAVADVRVANVQSQLDTAKIYLDKDTFDTVMVYMVNRFDIMDKNMSRLEAMIAKATQDKNN